MRIRTVLAAAAGALALVAVAPTPAPAAEGDGMVTVVHGIPGVTVDVYVNGDLTLDDFAPDTVTDPLALPPGTYDLAIRAGDADASADPILSGSAEVTAGLNATVVAHLDADGNPTLSVFANDVAPVAAGQARLVVRHTAAAPAVDVRANGSVAFSNLTNPNEAKADLPAGSIEADVVLAGTDTVAIGPATLDLAEGTSTIVYAVGSAADNNLKVLVQSISGLHSAPGGVNAGSGGLLEDSGNGSTMVLVLGSAALLTLGGGLLLINRARQRAADGV